MIDPFQLAPGWYTDKTDPAYVRYFDGKAWSAHRKPRPGLPDAYQQERRRARFQRTRRIG